MHLQLALGDKIKSYHAKKVGEQHNSELISILRKQGSAVMKTFSNSWNQNAICERKFQSLFNTARAALAHNGLIATLICRSLSRHRQKQLSAGQEAMRPEPAVKLLRLSRPQPPPLPPLRPARLHSQHYSQEAQVSAALHSLPLPPRP